MGLVEFGWPELRMGRRSMERGGRGKLGSGGLRRAQERLGLE